MLTQEQKFVNILKEFRLNYELKYYFHDGITECEHHYVLMTSTLDTTTNIGGFREHFMAYAFHKGEFLGAWINHGIPGERQIPGPIRGL